MDSAAAAGVAVAVEPDFFWLAPAGGFIIRTAAGWQIAHPVDKERVLVTLHHEYRTYRPDDGEDHPVDRAEELIARKQYPIVFRTQRLPVPTDAHPECRLRLDERTRELWYNLWDPPTLVPRPGPFPRITRLLEYLTAVTQRGDVPGSTHWLPDPNGRLWLEHWLAAKVQDPTRRPGVAVILTTDPGYGKNSLSVAMMELLGRGNCAELKRNDLDSNFTSSWADRFFVFADEIVSGMEARNTSELLKAYIASPVVVSERKYRDKEEITNRTAWMFASNDACPVVIEGRDRRYTVFDNRAPDLRWWTEIRGCFDLSTNSPTPSFMEEIAGFGDYLLHLDVSYELISRPYENEARETLKSVAKSSVESFLAYIHDAGLDAVLDDYQAATAQEPGVWWRKPGVGEWLAAEGIAKNALYEIYKHYHDQNFPSQKKVGRDRFCGQVKRANVHEYRPAHGTRPRMFWLRVQNPARFQRTQAAKPVAVG